MRTKVYVRKVTEYLYVFDAETHIVKYVLSDGGVLLIKGRKYICSFTYDKWGLKANLYYKVNDGRKPACFFRNDMKGSLAMTSSELRRGLFIITR
jgi:hypothetical protein